MSDELLQSAAQAVQNQFDASIEEFRSETTLIVLPRYIVESVQLLKEQFGFNFLVDMTAVDYFPQLEPRFHVIYQLYNMEQYLLLRLRVPVSGRVPEITTIEQVFANANWKEREIWDMFGINFDGHSDLRRILMPWDWQGHPLRKDYPLGYEEVQYSFNYEEIQQRKPFSKGIR